MSVEKKYLKTRKICKTSFTLNPEEYGDAEKVYLVGEFNDWNSNSLPMKKQKNGSFKLVLDLEVGRSYQFRYLLDSKRWENDWQADKYEYSDFGNCENSVVEV